MNTNSILSASGLSKHFRISARRADANIVTALDGVDLQIMPGESLGIAGESGCGKSTLAKIMAGLMKPDKGTVCYKETALAEMNDKDQMAFRRSTQMIFQDPFSSLNPRIRIGDSIAEPLKLAGMSAARQREETARIMANVGLDSAAANRFPDEFSGGQRQRIGIARALAANPQILIADEPVSSLDISIQAQIINLMQQMKSDYNLSMMIISHNLLVLRHICDRISIMYLGVIVENAAACDLFDHCRHPYTQALIAAIPGRKSNHKQNIAILKDDVPSPMHIPSGCRFHPRCRYAQDICLKAPPELLEKSPGHFSACHLSQQIFG